MKVISANMPGPDTIRARINKREFEILSSRLAVRGLKPQYNPATGEMHFWDGGGDESGNDGSSSTNTGGDDGDMGGDSYNDNNSYDTGDLSGYTGPSFGDQLDSYSQSTGNDVTSYESFTYNGYSLDALAFNAQFNPSAKADYDAALAAYNASIDLSAPGIAATLAENALENSVGFGVIDDSQISTANISTDAYSNEGRGASALSAYNAEYNAALTEAQENVATSKTGIIGFVVNQAINVVSGIVGTAVGTVTGTGPLGGAVGAKGTNAALNAGLEAAITGVSLSGYGNNTGISNTANLDNTTVESGITYSAADDSGMTTGGTGDNEMGLNSVIGLPIPKTVAEAQAYGALSGNNAAGQESYERLVGMPDDGNLDGLYLGKSVYSYTGEEIAAIRAGTFSAPTSGTTNPVMQTASGGDDLIIGLLLAIAFI